MKDEELRKDVLARPVRPQEVRVRKLKTGEELVTQAQDNRPAYQAAITKWLEELDQGCRTRELERVELTTDQPLDRALYDYLARRSQHY